MHDLWHRLRLAVALVSVLSSIAAFAWADEEPNAVIVMQADGKRVRQLARMDEMSCHGYPRYGFAKPEEHFNSLLLSAQS